MGVGEKLNNYLRGNRFNSRGLYNRPMTASQSKQPPEVGRLLRDYRAVAGMSQLDLALVAESSARHISFVETGRAKPSPALLARIAEALDLTLRDRNAVLLAAGSAPRYPERALDDQGFDLVRRGLDHLLRAYEPYPALVMNAQWDLYMANAPATALMEALGVGSTAGQGAPNLLRMMLHPDGLRQSIVDREQAARIIIRRARNEQLHCPNEGRRRLVEEVATYPGMPTDLYEDQTNPDPLPLLTVTFERGDMRSSWFTMVTTFGTPQDITLQELSIESFFPADAATDAAVRALAAD